MMHLIRTWICERIANDFCAIPVNMTVPKQIRLTHVQRFPTADIG